MSNSGKTKINQFYIENQNQLREAMGDFIPFLVKTKKEYGPEKAYLIARKMVDEMKQSVDFDSKTSCTGTCSFCCHSAICVSEDEGDYIKRVVKEKGIIPNQERLKKQKESNILSWADKACPLLSDPDEHGVRQCTIYEDRPLICRTHNSTEDPKNCDRSMAPDRITNELKAVSIDALMLSTMAAFKKSSEVKETFIHEIL